MLTSSTPNLSFIGIVDFSQEARWIFMTESVTDLLGYEPRDLVGRPSLELVHPDEFPRVKQLHYDTIQQDKAAVLVYLRMKHKDPLKGYVLCGVSRTVVHDILIGSVSFANPNKALQNASTAQEITVIAPEARNFQFRRWHDPSPMPPSPIPERMRILPSAFLNSLAAAGGGLNGGGGGLNGGGLNGGGLNGGGLNGGGMGMGMGGGARIEYVDVPDRSANGPNGHAPYAQSAQNARRHRSPSPSPPPSPPLSATTHRHAHVSVSGSVPASPYRTAITPTATIATTTTATAVSDSSSSYRSPVVPGYDRDEDDSYAYAARRGPYVASQESYARRRSPSYASSDRYERERERDSRDRHDRDRDRDRDRRYEYDDDYPPSPASPAYTPQSPYSSSHSNAHLTPLDTRRRLSDSSSSSSSGGSSGSFARSGASSNHSSHHRHRVNGGAPTDAGRDVDVDVDIDLVDDAADGMRRLGHSTSWTRRRVGSETPTRGTPVRDERVDGDGDRDVDVDVDMDRDDAFEREREREREEEEEEDRRRERQRERERELARDLEDEERRYRAERERYMSPVEARAQADMERDREHDRDRERERERDFAANRYYSPAPSSTSTVNGAVANGHHYHAATNGAVSHDRRSLTPSPPRPGYRSAPAPPPPLQQTYASVTRGSPPQHHLLPSPRILAPPHAHAHAPRHAPPHSAPAGRHQHQQQHRAPSPEPIITFDHLPAQSRRTAFILDRFTDKSSIMYCSNTLLISPTSSSSSAFSASSSPTTATGGGGGGGMRRSGSPPNRNGNGNGNAGAGEDLGQANAIGRPFFDFVAPRDEQTVRDWIACVKGWGVNEKGQPSDGGFGFGRFGLVREGRESAPRNPDPVPTSRGGRNRHGSTSGRGGRTTGAARRGMDLSGRRRPGGGGSSNTPSSTSNYGGSSPPGAGAGGLSGDSDAERERENQRQQRERNLTVIEVDAIFSAHSDGLMVILRRAS